MGKTDKTLKEFFDDIAIKVEKQSSGALAVGTMLTDLVDELGTLIKALHGRAMELSKEALETTEKMRSAVDAQDHDAWDKSSQRVFELKGRIEAYMEVAGDLQNLGVKVGRRSLETKH